MACRPIRFFAISAFTVLLAACGGGSDGDNDNPPPTNVGSNPGVNPAVRGVISGFTPDPQQVVQGTGERVKGLDYPDFTAQDGLDLGPAGGRTTDNPLGCNFDTVPRLSLVQGPKIGVGTTGDGGIGIGGAPGRLQNVRITVTYTDAKILGTEQTTSALVDDVRGMVTAYPGPEYTGGLIVTARGTPTGRYYDVATRTYRPFTEDMQWRAYVDSVRGNMAVSPVTEAAAQYVDSKGVYSEAAFRDANERVTQELNDCLPGAFKVRDITRLPGRILDENAGITSVIDEFSGRQNVAIAGMIKAFDQSATGLSGDPTMNFVTYLRQEMADLTMDGKRDGAPIVTSNSPTGEFINDDRFFSNVKWGIDQIWELYRDPSYAPLLDAQQAIYPCYEFENGVSLGGVDANNNPISTVNGVLKYFPSTNAMQFRREGEAQFKFQFSTPYRGVKEDTDQFGRIQQKEFIGGTQRTDAAGVTTIWEAKRTIVYVPSFFKKKVLRADQSSLEIQCYGQENPDAVFIAPTPTATPVAVTVDPDLNDGFESDTF